MDIKQVVDAAVQALENGDTKAIKCSLRNGFHVDYIFPSVSNDRVLSAWDLFLRVKTTVPENASHSNPWKLNYNDALGNILLQLAAGISDHELVRLLLEKGADVNSINKEGRMALHIACTKTSLEIIKLLTENSPAYILDLCDSSGDTPLDKACKCSSPEVVQFLLSQGSSVLVKDSRLYSPLLNAVFNAADYAIPIAILLLDAGVNINYARGVWGTALIAAIKMSATEMQKVDNSTPSQNYTYVDLIMLLIERGCDVNATNCTGQTALHIAIITEQEILVRKLLTSGSDIDRRDISGFTPLYYACKYGNQRLVDLLIISGANLRAHNWEATFERWRRSPLTSEKYIQLLHYVMFKSKQCFTLQNLCCIIIRKNVRNIGKGAIQLGLPPSLVKRLQLKDWWKYV